MHDLYTMPNHSLNSLRINLRVLSRGLRVLACGRVLSCGGTLMTNPKVIAIEVELGQIEFTGDVAEVLHDDRYRACVSVPALKALAPFVSPRDLLLASRRMLA